MIYVGIDDTDTIDTPGTNRLARILVDRLAKDFTCAHIVRHQLLFDPRIPYTSKNGSASIVLEPRGTFSMSELIDKLRTAMLEWFVKGSDPGLCVTETVPAEISDFALRCQRDIIDQDEARRLAESHGIYLEGLGGTQGGVIGALAAVGLIARANDGRIVQMGTWPDDLYGKQDVQTVRERGIQVQTLATGDAVASGIVDLGRRLRPNLREGRPVLFVNPSPGGWEAVRVV